MRKKLFTVYLLAAVKLIVFKYPLDRLMDTALSWQRGAVREGLNTANFTLLHTIWMYIRYRDRLNSLENLAGNVLVFVPFGILLPWADGWYRAFWRVLGGVFVFSAGIEVFQLLTALGAFDVDDILLNCLGGMAGYWIYCYGVSRFIRAPKRADGSG